jgi:small subunit ribosomal protein S16
VVRIRLKRFGRRHAAYYRLNAIEGRRPRDGRVLEELGWYAPENKPDQQVSLNIERIEYWLKMGAQPSDTVRQLLAKQGKVKK